MRRRKRPTPTLASLWLDAMLTGAATTTTLAIRVPQLATGTLSAAEARRMVGEKVAAAAQGAVRGGVAMARLARRKPRLLTPFDIARDALDVATAMSGPARRKVKANAKRLSARKTRRPT